MTIPENRLKRQLKAGGATPIGTWIMSTSPVVAEAIGWIGFDFVVVDMEHSPLDLMTTVSLMQALAGTGTEPIVRVPWNDMVTVKRLLDAGARTLMFPMVQSAEEARAAVASVRYPPRGVRGVAGIHRGSRFGTVPGYHAGADAEIAVIVQIETPEAVAAREAIMDVDGVDGIFVGPSDLAAAMGHLGNTEEPEVKRLLRETAAAARARGVPCGIVGHDVAASRAYQQDGFSFVAMGSDIGIMLAGARGVIAELRDAAAAAPGGSAY